jgi:NAD-dependent deacetylase
MLEIDSLEYSAKQCAALIKKSRSIIALTGAGVSTNAGMPDFRGPRGLYVTKQYDAQKVFDSNYFARDAKLFYDFTRDFIQLEEQIVPTITHKFFAQLEKSGQLNGIVTQNIDSLHQRAGSKCVYELHGSFEKSFCQLCQKEFSFVYLKELVQTQVVPICDCGGILKPDIVFFGDEVKCFSAAVELIKKSDLLFIVGTSCVVQPAAQLPNLATGDIVIVNQGKVELDSDNITLRINADADEFFMRVHNYL